MAHNESEFTRKLKRLCSNRAVVVTVITLLVATGIVLAVTVSANRASRPGVGGNQTTETVTDTQAAVKDETLPTYKEEETLPVAGDPDADKYTLPVGGKLMKAHDPTIQVYSNTMGDYRVHLGLDIATEAGAAVCAVADGTVEKIWNDSLMGTCLALTHAEDTVTIYKNLAPELAEGITVGASVTQGQQIATVGETAVVEMADEPHLHFEMTVNGISVDPLKYFSDASVETLSKDTAFENTVAESETAGMTSGK